MALERSASDFWNTYFNHNTSAEVGKETDGTTVNGALRFTNITIPQGTSIQEAILGFYVGVKGAGSGDLRARIWGIDEDNTGSFGSSPMGRSKTDAVNTDNWSLPSAGEFSNHNVTSLVQEIINRGGWSSGNAMGFLLEDNGSPNDVWAYDSNLSTNSKLTITLSSISASVSPSSSASPSRSPSSSYSPSASLSPSASISASPSATPPPDDSNAIIRVGKSGINVLANPQPHQLKFSSEYGTLKYYAKQTVQVQFNAATGDITGVGSFDHNLNYYPYCEIFVKVSVGGSPVTGNYEYVPFSGSGASVLYAAIAKITKHKIFVYGQINGVSASTWTFDFLIFVYKNRLNL